MDDAIHIQVQIVDFTDLVRIISVFLEIKVNSIRILMRRKQSFFKGVSDDLRISFSQPNEKSRNSHNFLLY